MPPLSPVAQIDWSSSRGKDESARLELIRGKIRKQRRLERPLGDSQVAGVGNEVRKLGVGNRMLLDRKSLHMLGMDRALIGIELLGAHSESSPWQLDQIRQRTHKPTLASCVNDQASGVGYHKDHPGGVMPDPAQKSTVQS